MKIVINKCYGNFRVSKKAYKRYKELNNNVPFKENASVNFRIDPILIQIVEEMGEEASGQYSNLKVVEIPDDVDWEIKDYDGVEWIAEKHRTWR